MNGTKNTMQIDAAGLLKAVEKYYTSGYRLVQICCVKEPEKLVLHYTFDKDYNLIDLTMDIVEGTQVASITAIYPCAFLYENEIHDLFGVSIRDINVDYKGQFYKISIPRPFNPEVKASEPQKRN